MSSLTQKRQENKANFSQGLAAQSQARGAFDRNKAKGRRPARSRLDRFAHVSDDGFVVVTAQAEEVRALRRPCPRGGARGCNRIRGRALRC